MRNFNSHSQLYKKAAYTFLPGEGIPAEVCDLQGFAEFDAFRNFWNVWKKRHERKRGLRRIYHVENGTPGTGGSLRHSKTTNFHSSGPMTDHSAGLRTVLTLRTEMHRAVQYAKKQDCGASIPPLSSDLTITGDVQFHQLHEVGNLRGKSLYFIVAQAQFAQVQKPKERLRQEENKTGSAAVLWKMCRLTSGQN